MFGQQLDWEWWVLLAVGGYALFRVAFAGGQVLARWAADGEPPATVNCTLALLSGLALVAAAVAGLWLVWPGRPVAVRVVLLVFAAPFLIATGAVADLFLGIYAFNLSQRLAALRVPRHRERLSDFDPAARLRAARRLFQLNTYAAPAVPELVAALKDDEADVRGYAALALWASESDDPEVPRAARAALADPDPRVRAAAAVALTRFKPPPEEVLPALAAGAMLEDDQFASPAARAIGELGEVAAPAAGVLRAALFDRDPPNPLALDALSKIGPAGVPVLVEVLRQGTSTDRRSAAEYLGGMGDAAKEAIPALREAARADDGVGNAAREALKKLGAEIG